MLQVILRAATTTLRIALNRSIPKVIASLKLSSSNYSSKNTKSSLVKAKKAKSKADIKSDEASAAATDNGLSDLLNEEARDPRLIEDDKDPSLNISPNGRALFTSTTTISQLSRKDICTYMKFSNEGLNVVLLEGLSRRVVKEFEELRQSALLVHHSFWDLRDNFRCIDESASSAAL